MLRAGRNAGVHTGRNAVTRLRAQRVLSVRGPDTTRPLAPGETLYLEWVPTLSSSAASGIFEIELCLGTFGPSHSVQTLKMQISLLAAATRPWGIGR